jgi:hypothetical protein
MVAVRGAQKVVGSALKPAAARGAPTVASLALGLTAARGRGRMQTVTRMGPWRCVRTVEEEGVATGVAAASPFTAAANARRRRGQGAGGEEDCGVDKRSGGPWLRHAL